jgi:hypothetical protein
MHKAEEQLFARDAQNAERFRRSQISGIITPIA